MLYPRSPLAEQTKTPPSKFRSILTLKLSRAKVIVPAPLELKLLTGEIENDAALEVAPQPVTVAVTPPE